MAVVNSRYDYQQFREAVRKRLGSNLACYDLTPYELEKYMQQEEDQIEAAFKSYQAGCESLSEDACFNADVNGVSYCLKMCY